MIAAELEVDREVFRRYAGLSLPRHVSYPMPTWWKELDDDAATAMHRDSEAAQPLHDLSLYIHIPFCEALCKFCACNRVIQRRDASGADERTDAYVHALEQEIVKVAAACSDQRRLRQIHWGGGTPTYLSAVQIEHLHNVVVDAFSLSPDAEISIEIDPRVTPSEMLTALRQLGFNRLSMGVQDFDEKVQSHVRRVQPLDMVRDTVVTCRDLGFDSVNFDLIYGMPYQTPETIRDTVEKTIALAPDRVAYYHYAQIPEKIATQRGMDYTKLPGSETKLEMFLIGLDLFTAAGYDFIGLDHFAKPDEGLSQARSEGSLQRNFQGMTTGGGLDLIGMGVSAISQLVDVGFVQNLKDTDAYIARIKCGDRALERGKRLTTDDLIRQDVIGSLYCDAEVVFKTIEQRFAIVFEDYFARELGVLGDLERDGLVRLEPEGTIRITCPLGRVLARNVAAVFDAYLSPDAYRVGERSCFSANA